MQAAGSHQNHQQKDPFERLGNDVECLLYEMVSVHHLVQAKVNAPEQFGGIIQTL